MSSVFGEYKAVKDSATEAFLRTKAIEMEKRDISRTYVALSSDLTVLEFVTLGIKCMNVPQQSVIRGGILRKMNLETKTGIAQSYLLGQLSRSEASEKGLGSILIGTAMRQFKIAKKAVGCRMVRLDCDDELTTYYEQFGFRFLRKSDDKTLNQMIAFIDREKLGRTGRSRSLRRSTHCSRISLNEVSRFV